jgi:hypothetical protein
MIKLPAASGCLQGRRRKEDSRKLSPECQYINSNCQKKPRPAYSLSQNRFLKVNIFADRAFFAEINFRRKGN